MKVLLFSMPDVGPQAPPRVWRAPNLGISSLAGNCPDHDVTCADLIVRREDIRAAVREAMTRTSPELVGLTSMSFQYRTALRVAELVKQIAPSVPIILGGYHATLMHEELSADERFTAAFDFMIRGEGETAFRMMVDALDGSGSFGNVPSLSWKKNGEWVHNERGPLEDLSKIALPNRSSRLWQGEYWIRAAQRRSLWEVLLGGGTRQPLDVIETSRGCTMPCSFCSIRHMYGRSFRTYDMERVMADIADAKRHSAEWLVLADDNVTLDVPRFEAMCDAIVAAGHNDISYIVQTSAAGIASSAVLAKKMDRANMRVAQIGIESVSTRNLTLLKKGDIREQAKTALRHLHDNNILVVGSIILGNPEDTEEDIAQSFDFMLEHGVEFFADQILQPYPKTGVREELLKQGLITRPDAWWRYNGFWANVRTRNISEEGLQYLQWKYHQKGSKYTRTSTFRAAYPLYAVLRRYLVKPMKLFLARLKNWNRTRYEVFRESMREAVELNNFFGDTPNEWER
ncbi:MAG TPA: radical SAM protein [Planctomycetota bacterium]|nr:radical SAM protein [Planctomycetota bacterium]